MAYYDDPLVDPDGFAQEQALLDQQAARIKALRQRGAQPWEPSLKEIGGFTLSTQTPGAAPTHIPGRIAPATWGSALSALAPLVADYTAGKQEAEHARGVGALDARQRKAALDWANNIPQDTPYSAVPLDPTKNLVEATVTPAAPADPAKVLKHAVAGLNNKYSAKTAQALLDAQAVDIPKETRQREFLTQKEVNDANARFVLEAEKAKATAAEKELDRTNARDVATIRANATRAAAGAGGNYAWTYMGPDPNDPTKGLWADPRNPTAPPVQGALKRDDVKPAKPMPVSLQNKYNSNNVLDKKLTEILSDTDNTAATGYIKGKVIQHGGDLGAAILNKWSTAGEVERRAIIAKLSATEIHDMSGATVTLAEYPRFKPYIPLLTDPPEVVASKARQLQAAIRQEQIEIEQMAESQGYRSPKMPEEAKPSPAAPKPPPAPGAPAAATSPTSTVADPRSAVGINKKAYDEAVAAYKRNPTPANEQKRDLAWADWQRAVAAGNEPAAAPPAAPAGPLGKSKSKAELYKAYGL